MITFATGAIELAVFDGEPVFGLAMLVASVLFVTIAMFVHLSRPNESDDEGRSAAALLAEAAADMILIVSADGTIAWANAHARSRLGVRSDIGDGGHLESATGLHDESLRTLLDVAIPGALAHGHWEGEINVDRATFLISAIRQTTANTSTVAVFARDISRLKDTERELRDSRAKADAVLETAVDAIITIDDHGHILSANPAAEEMFGYRADELIGHNVTILMPEPYRSEHDQYLTNYRDGGDPQIIGIGREVEGRRRDGTTFPIDLAVSEIILDDRRIFSGIARDKGTEVALATQASTDHLTGLPNRTHFDRTLDHLMTQGRPGLGVLFIDVDHFKQVNDTFGHQIGDQVLVSVARRIGQVVRGEDQVFRQSGDEFLVIAHGLMDEDAAHRLADRIGAMFDRPLQIDDQQVHVTVSIGAALRTESSRDRRSILEAADVALYRAKDDGRARHQIFDATLQSDADVRRDLEEALRAAVVSDELRVHYQPIIDMTSGRVVSTEAFVRWDRPGHGIVPAADFVRAAESTSLISDVGRFVLHQACRDMTSWNAHRIDSIGVAVNISAAQMAADDFVDTVRSALATLPLPAELLTLEITETALLSDRCRADEKLDELNRLGVTLSLDDFGTGYTSIAHLRDIPVTDVKIDRDFVQSGTSDDRTASMLDGVVTLIHALGLSVTAEGVETEEQADLVRRLGCERAQGFLWARPGPVESCRETVRELDALAGPRTVPQRPTSRTRSGAPLTTPPPSRA